MKGKFKILLIMIVTLIISAGSASRVYATDILTSPASQDPVVVTDPSLFTVPSTGVTTDTVTVPSTGLTYIDISIDTQTLVYYVNGSPVLVTPCVTGSPGRSTPKGVFQINSCVPGKRLKGPTWDVWVDRWMRFCGSCGIHDAKWRKSFGGDIYKKNGSHGCVNLPHDQAVLLYSMVGVGTTVIVH